MNTLSKGVTVISLPDGQHITLKFGLWAIRELCRMWNCTMADLQGEGFKKRLEQDYLSALIDIVKAGALYAAAAQGKAVTYNDAQVSSWIDDTGGITDSPVIDQVMTAFVAAFGGDLAPVPTPQTTQTTGAADPNGLTPAPVPVTGANSSEPLNAPPTVPGSLLPSSGT